MNQSLQLPIQMKPFKQKKKENDKPIPRAPFLVASVATKTLPLNRLQQITFQFRAFSYFKSSSNHVLISGLVINASSAIVAILVPIYQILHLARNLFHPVLWVLEFPALIRQSVCYFVSLSLFIFRITVNASPSTSTS
ncbi:hypothetical protein ERO13_A09G139100v2 [Gossypium hirsutum]|nr:hypothetical protein ERO13_A09G139100v2 [Gossypium hirsutum]KAG4183926.1 hypothetical protein ERO13_A09G139100v2 [Gossypium hirsutum]